VRSLFADLSASLRNPEFWAFASWLDVVSKYRQSRLGIFWLLAPPNIYVWGIGAFFASMYGRSLAEFAAHIAIGTTVFRLVTAMVIESTGVFTSNYSFIMDGHVRLTDFLLRVLAKALFYFAVALPVIAAALLMYPDVHLLGLALAPLSLALVVANTLWIGLVISLVGARFTDVGQFTSNVFLFAFLLTPIVWYPSMAPAGSLRGSFMRLNPFFHMIEVIRAPILGEPLEPASVVFLGVMTVFGWMLAAFVYRRYSRFVPIWI
jgi:ABC-type polysaccharide/polyol phosphate export permease